MKEKFMKSLALLMKGESLTQSELSRRTGIPQSRISSWLLGKSTPSLEHLCVLADFFDISLDDLVGRKEY